MLNKVTLIGNLGKDPETRFMPNGKQVTTVSLATSESWKNKETGAKEDHTEWHRLVAFGRKAEIVSEYMKKGSKGYFEGHLRTRKWTDSSNVDRYTTEIIVDAVKMLDNKPATLSAPPASLEAPLPESE